MKQTLAPIILIAEDDPDDSLMLKDAFHEINENRLKFLNNGKLLLDDIYQLIKNNTPPKLVIVDLNMPVLDGRAVIIALKENITTRNIPIVVLSTSKNKDDIDDILSLGASAFYSKPATFNALVEITRAIAQNWLE